MQHQIERSMPIYTQDQLEIALLKNSQEGIGRTLSELKSDFNNLRQEVKTQGYWMMGLQLAMYGLIITPFISKFVGTFFGV